MSQRDRPAKAGLTRRAVLGGLAATGCVARAGSPVPIGPTRSPLSYDARGGLFLEAVVAGAERRLFILDTGASRSTLSRAFAETLGVKLRAGEQVTGTAGSVQTRSMQAELRIEGLSPLSLDWVVYEFGSYEPRCVGILGYELLSRQPFHLRYGAQSVEWGASLAPSGRVPLAMDGRIPRVRGRIEGQQIDFRLDTGATLKPGADFYLNLAPRQADTLGLMGRPSVKEFQATGTGGATLTLPVKEVRDFELGPVHVARAFAIVQPAVGYFAAKDAVGFLGNSVLDKLDPLFDYGGGALGLTYESSAG